MGSLRLRQSRERRRQTRRQSQRGGFYPSVFGGVANATILIPAVLRQGYRLWYDTDVIKNGSSKSKGKGKRQTKRRRRGHLLKDGTAPAYR